MGRRSIAVLGAVLAVVALTGAARDTEGPTLVGRAILPSEPAPASTTTECPDAPPAVAPPVLVPQPAGGYSALIDGPDDTFLAMPDNGYGAKGNSCDFVLRVDRVAVDFLRDGDAEDPGTVDVIESFQLRDPAGLVPFPIYRQADPERLLTGWDFDPESVREAPDGTFWFGDEFGPFLLHTDADGVLLEAPIPAPGIRAPENALPGADPVNLASSSGFESMAISPDGRYLYPALERALTTETDLTRRLVLQFDIDAGAWTDQVLTYPADPAIVSDPPGQPQHVLGDMTSIGGDRYVVIERDFRAGAAALFEKLFVIDLSTADADGLLTKTELVDLLDIADPERISEVGARPGDIGLGETFTFPYVTTESVLPVGDDTLALVNDDNFRGIGGRNPELPDYNDFIEVRVPDLTN